MSDINKNELNKENNPLFSKKRENFEFINGLFDKGMGRTAFFSSIISIIAAIIVVKGFVGYQDKKIQNIFDNCQELDRKVKNALDSIVEIESSVNFVKDDFKTSKEDFARVYADIASIQKSLSIIKEEFHIDELKNMEDSIKKLNSEKHDFIVSLENLVSEGMPFESFLESYNSKIDMKRYSATDELLKFKSVSVKPVSALKKDIASIGFSSFEIAVEEGFWEKQKRVIKEKIMDAIKIKKSDEKEESDDKKEADDKALYKESISAISCGDLEKALSSLENIKAKNDEITSLISDINKRLELNKAFSSFKNEFLELESKN